MGDEEKEYVEAEEKWSGADVMMKKVEVDHIAEELT